MRWLSRGMLRNALAACGAAIFAILANGLVSDASAADVPTTDVSSTREATTAEGDRVRLYPNGRWEYVDARKAEAQRPMVDAYEKEKSLEQGGLLGVGRKVKPGDPDYNRGSLGGKSK